MTTELSTVLREAVADAPPDDYDVLDVVEAGARRVRRRTTLVVGLSALVATAAVTALALGGERPAPEPAPADVVRLDLVGAERLDLDVLASVRSTSRGGTDLEREQFEGMTTDGLVLRSRYSNGGAKYELGLLDPETGTTDWLPPPPVAARQVVELTSDRLVLLGPWAVGPGSVLVFDRGSQTWERTRISLPEGVEVHVPPHLEIAPDGRLHLGSNMEGESGPIYWWSYALPVGGVESAEPDLTGAVVAWRDGVRATVDNEGRVVVSTAGTERLLADERPAGCDRASDPDEAEMPLWLDLAGDRPVVTYWCGDDFQPVTLVYDTQGGSAVQVAGAAVRAVDRRHVLLSATTGSPEGVYLLDLDRRTLAHIGSQPHEMQLALADGLVLWNQAGPSDDEDVYDVVWKVARLPLRD